MFAGPNGSGKSCFNNIVNSKWLGVYVNADEIEKKLTSGGVFLPEFKVELDDGNFVESFKSICLGRNIDLPAIQCAAGKVTVKLGEINSYYAAMIAELVRLHLLDRNISFTFETVMSHESKLDFLKLAKEKGYRTYLYFIATKDPEINIARVASRVKKGGHNVPQDKIVSRYHRAINLLPGALSIVDRGFVFDNSGDKEEWLIETSKTGEEGFTRLVFKSSHLPKWVRAMKGASQITD